MKSKSLIYLILGGLAVYAIAKHAKKKEDTYKRIVKLLIIAATKEGYSVMVVTEGSKGDIKVYDAETTKSLYAQALKDGAEIKVSDGIDLTRAGFPAPDTSDNGFTPNPRRG